MNNGKSNYFTETFGKKKNTDNKKNKKDKTAVKKQVEKVSQKKTVSRQIERSANTELKNVFQFEFLSSQFSTKSLPKDCIKILQNFDVLLQEIKPLNSRQLQQLPDNIRELSHQLTDQRGERRLGYMNENVRLSAYVRYFTWWNLVRMTRLFANLPAESFPQQDGICLDLGSGPLTIVNALWLARPELRKLNLTWYCLDVSQNALTLGEDIYMSVAAKTLATDDSVNQNSENTESDTEIEDFNHWKIIRIKDSFGSFIKQKADFITCGNMFNELDQSSDMPPEFKVKKYYEQLKAYAGNNAKFLLIEPGVPKSARTLSLFRERFLKDGNTVLAPCPHAADCPMNGFKSYTGSKNKWCNFAFSTEDAPQKLQKLSESSKLPKERAVLSFLSITKTAAPCNEKKDGLLLKVTSDPFSLPGHKTGFYACSELGLILITLREDSSVQLHSGDLLCVKTKTPDFASLLEKDYKSGALVINLR